MPQASIDFIAGPGEATDQWPYLLKTIDTPCGAHLHISSLVVKVQFGYIYEKLPFTWKLQSDTFDSSDNIESSDKSGCSESSKIQLVKN